MTIRFDQPVLNSARNGAAKAAELLAALESHRVVEIDWSAVQRVTPSYCNAFLMPVLDAIGYDHARQRLRFVNADPLVAQAITKTLAWYRSGIRTSGIRVSA